MTLTQTIQQTISENVAAVAELLAERFSSDMYSILEDQHRYVVIIDKVVDESDELFTVSNQEEESIPCTANEDSEAAQEEAIIEEPVVEEPVTEEPTIEEPVTYVIRIHQDTNEKMDKLVFNKELDVDMEPDATYDEMLDRVRNKAGVYRVGLYRNNQAMRHDVINNAHLEMAPQGNRIEHACVTVNDAGEVVFTAKLHVYSQNKAKWDRLFGHYNVTCEAQQKVTTKGNHVVVMNNFRGLSQECYDKMIASYGYNVPKLIPSTAVIPHEQPEQQPTADIETPAEPVSHGTPDFLKGNGTTKAADGNGGTKVEKEVYDLVTEENKTLSALIAFLESHKKGQARAWKKLAKDNNLCKVKTRTPVKHVIPFIAKALLDGVISSVPGINDNSLTQYLL